MRKAWATSHCRLQPHTVLGVRLEYSQGVPLPFSVNLETRCDWAWQRPETSGGRGISAWGGVTSTALQLSVGVSEEAIDTISQDHPIKWEMLWLDGVVLKWHHTQHMLEPPPGNATCYSSHAGPGKESRVKERP